MYVSVDVDLGDQPKFRRAARALGIDRSALLWHLYNLWGAALRQRRDGFLIGWESSDVEYAAKWTGEPGDLFAMLLSENWLEKTGSECLVLHDWIQHQHYARESLRHSNPKLYNRLMKRNNSGKLPVKHGKAPLPSGSSSPSPSPPTTSSLSPPTTYGAERIRAVFTHYKTYHPRKFPRIHSALKEWAKIKTRMKDDGYTAEDLCAAIDGMHKTPHNMGVNDRNEKYLDLELCMRDAKHVDRYREAADGPVPQVGLSAREMRNRANIEEGVRIHEQRKRKGTVRKSLGSGDVRGVGKAG